MWEWIKDRIWATLEGPVGTPQEVPERLFSGAVGEPLSAVVLAGVATEENAEEERRRAVDQKLQGMLQFGGISVTLLLGVATFLADPKYRQFGVWPLTIAFFVASYVSLQFLRAVFAAVSGLERKGFERLTLSQLACEADDDAVTYQHRLARLRAECLARNAEVVNAKVSSMAVAHVALKNGLTMLVVGIYTLTVIVLWQAWQAR